MEHPPIRLKRITVWRKGGAFATPKTKGAKRRTYMAQVGPSGKVLDVVEELSRSHVVKTTAPGSVEANDGLIQRALGQTNAFTASLGAKHVMVRVSYTTPDGKREAFKLDHQTTRKGGLAMARSDINSLMVGSIVQELRRRGYRTRYQIQAVDWGKVRDKFRRSASGGRLNVTSRTQVARRSEVSDVQIRVEYRR